LGPAACDVRVMCRGGRLPDEPARAAAQHFFGCLSWVISSSRRSWRLASPCPSCTISSPPPPCAARAPRS
jgi:hypothetical protein